MKNNIVLELWDILEKNPISFGKRLISGDFKCPVYCTYQYPDQYFGIALSFANTININLRPFSDLSEIKLQILQDLSFDGKNMLSIQLVESKLQNIFSYLCSNVVESIERSVNEDEAVKSMLNTLAQWKELFGRVRSKGLSIEEQQGLYGELSLLQRILSLNLASQFEVIQSWVGSDRALRDFQRKGCAVECKTTTSNNPQQLVINGERQLDDSLLESLFLFHLSLEASRDTGETLVDKVETLRNILKNDISSLNLFEAKLFEAGYFNIHAEIYKDRAYKTRGEFYYHVYGDFPRIREKELRDGVGNVHYGIVLAHCEPNLVTECFVLEKLFES